MSAEGRAKISAAAKRRYEGRSRQLQCQQCGIRYTAIESQIARGRGKFCSRDCKGRASRGVSVAAQTEFKPGIVPWNKGLELPEYSGDKSPSWKAEDISYSGLHRWVRRHIGVKNYCEHCLRSNLARYDLANKPEFTIVGLKTGSPYVADVISSLIAAILSVHRCEAIRWIANGSNSARATGKD